MELLTGEKENGVMQKLILASDTEISVSPEYTFCVCVENAWSVCTWQ